MKQTMNSIKNSIASLLRSTGVLTITVGVLMTATAACSETELATGTAGNEAWLNDPDALRISATVGGAFGSNGAATRTNPMGDMDDDASTDQTVFNPGDTIGVYTDDQDKVLYTLSADGTTWKPLDGKYLKWTSDEMQVYAYYPVTSYVVTVNGGTTSKNDAKNFTLSNVQNTAERIAKADYMTFNGIVTRTKGSANLKLQMQRRTARVIINITSAGDEIDKEKDEIKFPQIGSLYQTYTNDVASDNTGRNVTPYADQKGKNGFNSQFATRFTTLVIPAEEETVSSYVNWFAISVNGKHFKVSTIPAMKAGYSYTYNLKLGKDKVTISGITVQDWTTGAVLPDGQEAEEKENYFPDMEENNGFAYWLTQEGKDKGVVEIKDENNGDVTLTKINGKIDPFDADTRDKLNSITYLQINAVDGFALCSSLEGIEFMPNLEHLECNYNGISSLDVSMLKKLTYLDCSHNDIPQLDVSKLTKLTHLDCGSNLIPSLDVSNLTKLTYLDCSNNKIPKLAVSKLTGLTYLDCGNNLISSLDVSMLTGLTYLVCNMNHLSTLDISPLSVLEALLCGGQTDGNDNERTINVTATKGQADKFTESSGVILDGDEEQVNERVNFIVK